jgi:hypothetical protein
MYIIKIKMIQVGEKDILESYSFIKKNPDAPLYITKKIVL